MLRNYGAVKGRMLQTVFDMLHGTSIYLLHEVGASCHLSLPSAICHLLALRFCEKSDSSNVRGLYARCQQISPQLMRWLSTDD